MEKRKIQKTGSSSFIITLPKDWVNSMGLKSGNYVYVYKYGDKLIITPSDKTTENMKSDVRIVKPVDTEQVYRILVSMYLSGYSHVTVTYDPTIPDLAKRIRELKNKARIKLAGVEVIDESHNSISFRILLNIRDLPLPKAIMRLHSIVDGMVKDALIAFKEYDESLAETVIQRDDEADRFHFMINRQLAMALLDIQIMQELGVTNPIEILNYRVLARNLERIADHSVNIAKQTFYRDRDCVLCGEIYELGMEIAKLFNKAMEGFYKSSRHISEETISNAKKIIDKIEEFLKNKILLSDIKGSEKIVLTRVIDSLRRITRYSNGIAEITLNIKACRINTLTIK